MKKTIYFLIVVVICSMISLQTSTAANTEIQTFSEEVCSTCSGEFKVKGKSYTITLHDVSWWTCVNFKVASWFN